MKKSIHPAYGPVVYRDKGASYSFLTRSTRTSSETVLWEDGNIYPVVDVEVSSASHPAFTGREGRTFSPEGAVGRFYRRYGR